MKTKQIAILSGAVAGLTVLLVGSAAVMDGSISGLTVADLSRNHSAHTVVVADGNANIVYKPVANPQGTPIIGGAPLPPREMPYATTTRMGTDPHGIDPHERDNPNWKSPVGSVESSFTITSNKNKPPESTITYHGLPVPESAIIAFNGQSITVGAARSQIINQCIGLADQLRDKLDNPKEIFNPRSCTCVADQAMNNPERFTGSNAKKAVIQQIAICSVITEND